MPVFSVKSLNSHKVLGGHGRKLSLRFLNEVCQNVQQRYGCSADDLQYSQERTRCLTANLLIGD
ncbi:hypothetical protein [Pseudomonas chlororaphis]|uniref:hypothetical protein n=1 Tax=Pseudomonas chlororaphis TaxID=587753 RepID=UPI003B75BFD1